MIKNILLILEFALLVIFIIPLFSGILNPGNLVGIIVSITLFGITFFFDKFRDFCINTFASTCGKIFLIFSAVIVATGIIYCVVLSAFMLHSFNSSPENAKAVIVLGCKVNGETPSRMLARRLDSAYEFLCENDDVICIVSGGKGDDEKISEALAMKSYLTQKGISADRVIMEDKSTNTYENLKFSAEILKEYDIRDVAIVTDGFHQYRASYIAKAFNLNTSAINAENDCITRPLIPTYWVREWMAITKEYII